MSQIIGPHSQAATGRPAGHRYARFHGTTLKVSMVQSDERWNIYEHQFFDCMLCSIDLSYCCLIHWRFISFVCILIVAAEAVAPEHVATNKNWMPILWFHKHARPPGKWLESNIITSSIFSHSSGCIQINYCIYIFWIVTSQHGFGKNVAPVSHSRMHLDTFGHSGWPRHTWECCS